MRLGLRGVAWGSIGHVIFFRKRLAALAGCWLESRHAQLVSRQFQSDPGPVKPAGSQSLGTQVIYDSLWCEVAKFDDACTGPTPCLLLPDNEQLFLCQNAIIALQIGSTNVQHDSM